MDDDSLGLSPRRCDCCDSAELIAFSDLGLVPVEIGQHYPTEVEAMSSPVGRIVLGYCPHCGYVRNLAFDQDLIDPAAPTDMNLYFSPTFRRFCSELIVDISDRLALSGQRILEVGCAQGEFLRELCSVAPATGVGFDASYDGVEGPDPSGAELYRGPAPLDSGLPAFDALVSRFVLEHVADVPGLLRRLRASAGDRPVVGHLQVPDAEYDLSTAGWEVIYPHVSYLNESALAHVLRRTGWRVTSAGTVFSGLIRYADVVASSVDPSAPSSSMESSSAALQRHLASIVDFDARHHAERDRWRTTIGRLADEGAQPVLWGAGSRGTQLLNYADRDRRFAAVVDVNPTKWGRYLPAAGHRVDPPESLRGHETRAVVITNPVYRTEIEQSLADLGVKAEVLVA